jgi:putative transposase
VRAEFLAEGKSVSLRKLLQWFGFSKSSFYYRQRVRRRRSNDADLEHRIRRLIDRYPAYGLRRIHACLRREIHVNRKKIHRILKKNSWQIFKKPKGHRPRVHGLISRSSRSNERWAIDTTHIFCGRDGWCHLTAIIDCFDRHIVGWRFSSRGVADVAAAALEESIRSRVINGESLTLRSDNGLVFGAKVFTRIARAWGIRQEFITPYTPEQNGMIERFFLSLKEECVWLNNFPDKDTAFEKISRWIDVYHRERPHSALGYLTPYEFKERIAA